MTKAEGAPQSPKETHTREQITSLSERVKTAFPGAHAGIIIRYPDSQPIGVGQTEPMYMASMSKPFSVLAALQMGLQQRVDLRANVFEFQGEEHEALQTELRELKKDENFVVEPTVSFQNLANYSLGVSSNVSLSILRRWMDEKLQDDEWGRNAVDYTQDLVETILKKALGKNKDEIVWAFNNSTKELTRTGLWNCATLEEVETIFQLIAEGDPRLRVSRDVIGIMRGAMRESIDSDLELTEQFKRDEQSQGQQPQKLPIIDAFGKFGEYTLKDDEKIEPLFGAYNIVRDGTKLLCIGATERITPITNGNINVAYFAAIPLPETATDEEVAEIKRQAGQMMTSELKKIIFQ
jgi:hypothetical protein